MFTQIWNAKAYVRRGVFAQSLLIEDDRIKAVGSNSEIDALAPAGTRKIDAEGGLLLPGFYDSHLHAAHAGRCLHEIQVRGALSIEDLVQKAKTELERIRPKESVPAHGTGWNQAEFTAGEKRFPNRRDLDRITASRPLVLSRVCGHTVSCNTPALKAAGIGKNFPDCPEGCIERDSSGNPTGVFHGNATNIVRALIKPYTASQVQDQITHTLGKASSFGITSAASHDVFGSNGSRIVESYNAIFAGGKARVRVCLQCNFTAESQLRDFHRKGWVTGATLGHPFLKMGPLKLFADGSLGSRTAFMLEPYSDAPEVRGYQDMSAESMNRAVEIASGLGYQVVVHAIGDGGVEQTVAALERVTGPGSNPRRHGVVHCQVASESILKRMAKRGILALVQPIFLTHDIHIAVQRLGPNRAAFCHAFGSMKRLGIPLAFGTDHPVESLNPLDCIQCAVLRRDLEANEPLEGYYPDECLDVADAVDAYTLGSAFSSREESLKGRIQSGFLADLVLLDKDIFSIPPDTINTARVVFTMTGGQYAFP